MTRYDNAQGFVIFNDGVPFQAMYRAPTPRMGNADGVYWLLPTDGPMPAEMALFVYTVFAKECVDALAQRC